MNAKANQTLNTKKIPLNHDSWDEAIAAFESDLYRRNQSEATIKTYGACLNIFFHFYRDHLKKPGPYVARLQETDFNAFIDYLRHDRHLSASSVNRYIAALRSFSKFVFSKRLHRSLLTNGLKTYRVRAKEDVPRLSKPEVRRGLHTPQGDAHENTLHRGTPMKICVSYPVDVCYLIIYTKKNSLN